MKRIVGLFIGLVLTGLLAAVIGTAAGVGASTTGDGGGTGGGTGAAAAAAAVTTATQSSPEPTGNPYLTPTVTTSNTGMVQANSPYLDVGVQLPNNPTTTTPVGSSTVATASNGTNAVVTPGYGNVQLAQVIPAQPTSDTTTYVYPMHLPAGFHLLQMTETSTPSAIVPPTGSVAITTATDESSVTSSNTLGFIQPAWSKDANGAAVTTSYSILWGTVLIQTVNTSGVTAYPVVVDPQITFGWVIYVFFSHTELYWEQVLHFVDGAGAGLSWICGLATWVLGIVCALVFLWLANYFDGIIQTAYNRGGGVVFEWTYWLQYYGYMYAGSWS